MMFFLFIFVTQVGQVPVILNSEIQDSTSRINSTPKFLLEESPSEKVELIEFEQTLPLDSTQLLQSKRVPQGRNDGNMTGDVVEKVESENTHPTPVPPWIIVLGVVVLLLWSRNGRILRQ